MIVFPISSGDEGERFICRPSGATPESQEITVMPRSIAFFNAGTSASRSLAETAIASTSCAISALITSIWPSAVVSVGPVIDDLDVAELGRGLLGALRGRLEEADAERLRHQRDPHRIVLRRERRGEAGGQRGRGE